MNSAWTFQSDGCHKTENVEWNSRIYFQLSEMRAALAHIHAIENIAYDELDQCKCIHTEKRETNDTSACEWNFIRTVSLCLPMRDIRNEMYSWHGGENENDTKRNKTRWMLPNELWRRRLPHYSRLLEHSVWTKYSKRLVMLQLTWLHDINVNRVKEKSQQNELSLSRAAIQSDVEIFVSL